jgi:hypothetical protein
MTIQEILLAPLQNLADELQYDLDLILGEREA